MLLDKLSDELLLEIAEWVGINVYYPFLASTIAVYGPRFLGPLEGEVKTTHRILTFWGWISSHVLFDKRDPKLLQQEPCKGAETDFQTKFSKETIAEVFRRTEWIPSYGA